MNWEVFVTCAVTGAGDTVGRSEHVPVTPEQIADAAIEAARAGAAVAHIHVRDPDTGRGARDPALYRAVVERIRASDVDVVLNLTAGMGGDLVLGGEDAPLPPDEAGTDMAGAAERLAHVEELRPEICTLDCGTMNFAAGGDYVMVNTPAMLRAMAARDPGARRAAGARGVRHRPPRVRPRADPRRPDRRPAADPALHRHPVRRARRPRHAARDGQPAAGERGLLRVLDRADGAAVRRARAARRARTCASGSRTTSTSRAGGSRRTASSSRARSRSSSG